MSKRRNRLLMGIAGWLFFAMTFCTEEMLVQAGNTKDGHDFLSSGVAEVLDPGEFSVEETTREQKEELNIHEKFDVQQKKMEADLAMADVQNVLNIRAQATEKSEKVGYLYRDCGGVILERSNGWTKIKSGSVIGWAKDDYLLFGEDAKAMAEEVGNWIVTPDTEAVRVRLEPAEEAEVLCYLAKDDSLEFIEIIDDEWVCIEYQGDIGYVKSEFINVDFHIDEGETVEVVRIRAKEEAERKRTENRGAVPADADELRLLGALIYCEAGNQSYEGMVGVGAVVMNRLKDPAYPNTIHGVIYSSGQFSPAMSGMVARVYAGNVPEMCMLAAQAAINGETTVGDAKYFRRAGRHAGYVLGDHVFW